VLPTDTVYGVAALPTVAGATGRLFALKGRAADVPIAVLVADMQQAATVAEVSDRSRSVLTVFWPGPLTAVLPRQPSFAAALGSVAETVGVRCPDHDFVRAVAARVGPIATTSANRHGEPTAVDAVAAAASLDGDVAVVVDGGRCDGTPSTVVDLTVWPPRVLRAGAISESDVVRATKSR
jgi:tRNA threonylcarbamoyl adenosine modification protein (Sua5/YciO/YrdC/YwlC family)